MSVFLFGVYISIPLKYIFSEVVFQKVSKLLRNMKMLLETKNGFLNCYIISVLLHSSGY